MHHKEERDRLGRRYPLFSYLKRKSDPGRITLSRQVGYFAYASETYSYNNFLVDPFQPYANCLTLFIYTQG